MRADIPKSPAEIHPGPVTTDGADLRSATPNELQTWFREAEETGKISPELSRWDKNLRRMFEKWNNGMSLSESEVSFLVDVFTWLSGSPEEFLEAAISGGFKLAPWTGEIRRVIQEVCDRDKVQVEEAWKELEKAFVRQVAEADCARRSSRASSTQILNEFNVALTELRQAVKRHSGTPAHRAQQNPERDRVIHRMRNEGKTYGEIALALNRENPRRKVTPNQVQRSHERYRERSQTYLRGLFRETFKQPPQKMPR